MEQRLEWVLLASKRSLSLGDLSHGAGVCRKMLYNWQRRFESEGREGLIDLSTTPLVSPERTSEEMESPVVSVRERNPRWGARKIRSYLEKAGKGDLPAASTVHRILARRGLVDAKGVPKAWKRFEMEAPNLLWQLDLKRHIRMRSEKRCRPMTGLDDHSRFAPALDACRDERCETVQGRLTEAFRRYGVPDSIINFQRPHQALGMKTPSELYEISPIAFQERLP